MNDRSRVYVCEPMSRHFETEKWFFYDTKEELQDLLDVLCLKGVREYNLNKKIKNLKDQGVF